MLWRRLLSLAFGVLDPDEELLGVEQEDDFADVDDVDLRGDGRGEYGRRTGVVGIAPPGDWSSNSRGNGVGSCQFAAADTNLAATLSSPLMRLLGGVLYPAA